MSISNNCTEWCDDKSGILNQLTPGHKRTAQVIALEVKALAKEFGIGRIGFLTLTFSDHVTNIREAQRRYHSLHTHVIAARYERGVGVWERQKSGRVHFHLVVVLRAEIRSGFDFEACERRDYRSACPALRSEWAFWRNTAPAYRFGRTELLPVKSTAEGIARYVGKYVSKHVREREESDKGARIARFWGYPLGTRSASTRFAWATENSWLWREKLRVWAAGIGAKSVEDLSRMFGKRWCYFFKDEIMNVRLHSGTGTVYPSQACAERDYTRHCVTEMEAYQFEKWKAKRPEAARWKPYQLKPFLPQKLTKPLPPVRERGVFDFREFTRQWRLKQLRRKAPRGVGWLLATCSPDSTIEAIP